MTKPQEFRELSAAEITEKVDTLRKELFTLRGKAPGGKVEKPSMIRKTRKDIARLLTILKEKEKTS